MNKNTGFLFGGNFLAALFTGIQTDVIFQYISLILTCIATLVTITSSLVMLVERIKKGTATKEDVKEVIQTIEKEKEKYDKIQ